MQSQSSEIQGKQISFMQKCIIMANILNEENKFVVNPFNNIPYVKLYTANLTIEKFVYTKIKGALILIYEENKGKTEFFLQIYDINDYSLVFSLPINKKLLEGVIIEERLIIIPTRNYFIGFKFSSNADMKSFILMLRCEKPESDINIKAKEYECEESKIINVINDIKTDFGKKLKKIDNENNIIEGESNSFLKLDELYRLVNCIEYSEINNKINIFIDKTINPYTIKSYIDAYRNSQNRNDLNNFEEEKRLIIFKKEHKKRHEKEEYSKNNDIRNSSILLKTNINIEDKNKFKNSILSNIKTIKEEDEENNTKKK